MSQLRFIFVFAICILLGSMYASPGGRIQVALLLDTSNSMDGLINQAKTQLWKVVNEFALARQDGKMPELEIALYEYGTEKENFVSAKAREREEIQEKIKALDLERRKYIAAKQREQGDEGTLDSAIIKALHEQAAEKNYPFDK